MANEDNKSAGSKSSSVSRRAKGSKKPESRVRSGLLTGGLALIFAVIALIGTGYLWYTLLLERAELLATDVVGDLEQLKGETAALRESLTETTGILDEVKATQDSVRVALDKIQNDLSRHRTEWVLAESEQLLVIANNRLQLARDVRSALAALRAADAQLNQVANPMLLPVRRELAREIAALDAIDRIDVSGISLKLGSLAESSDRLPLAPEVSRRAQALLEANAATMAPATAVDSGWRALARNLWQDVLSLVRIRTDLSTQRPLLPPEQEYFLHENLKLMLYGAQLALLQGNTAVFQQNLRVALKLLKDYYDANTQVVAGMQSELEKMRASKLVAELPDISRSLAALRAVSSARGAR